MVRSSRCGIGPSLPAPGGLGERRPASSFPACFSPASPLLLPCFSPASLLLPCFPASPLLPCLLPCFSSASLRLLCFPARFPATPPVSFPASPPVSLAAVGRGSEPAPRAPRAVTEGWGSPRGCGRSQPRGGLCPAPGIVLQTEGS